VLHSVGCLINEYELSEHNSHYSNSESHFWANRMWYYQNDKLIIIWALNNTDINVHGYSYLADPFWWNWYNSANKSYFCAKIFQFVVLVISRTICSKMTFTVRYAFLSAWVELDQRVIDSLTRHNIGLSTKQWQTHLHACFKAKGGNFERNLP